MNRSTLAHSANVQEYPLTHPNKASLGTCSERHGGSPCLAALRLMFIAVIPLLGIAAARADDCGLAGVRACNLNERIPSCDINLVEAGGVCVRPNCGAEGQKLCSPIQRTTFNWILMAPLPVPQACDINLKDVSGVCKHPASCGREGQKPCDIFERMPSCDVNLVEDGGICRHPPLCGAQGQPPCAVFVRGPLRTCDANLMVRAGACARPGSADVSASGAANSGGSNPGSASTTGVTSIQANRGGKTLPSQPQPTQPTSPAGSMEPDTDRIGNDMYGFNVAQADPAMCQTACSVNGECAAWTYVKPGIKGPLPRCYLKSSAPAPARNNCCVSGVRSGTAQPLLFRR
jgi:PAN domain